MSLGCAETPSDLSRVAVMGEDRPRMWNILEDLAMVKLCSLFWSAIASSSLARTLISKRKGPLCK